MSNLAMIGTMSLDVK